MCAGWRLPVVHCTLYVYVVFCFLFLVLLFIFSTWQSDRGPQCNNVVLSVILYEDCFLFYFLSPTLSSFTRRQRWWSTRWTRRDHHLRHPSRPITIAGDTPYIQHSSLCCFATMWTISQKIKKKKNILLIKWSQQQQQQRNDDNYVGT